MISSSAGKTCTSAAHTIDDIFIRDIDINCIVDLIIDLT